MCDDVPAFTDGSTKLIMSAVRQLLNCVVFAGKHSVVLNQPVFAVSTLLVVTRLHTTMPKELTTQHKVV